MGLIGDSLAWGWTSGDSRCAEQVGDCQEQMGDCQGLFGERGAAAQSQEAADLRDAGDRAMRAGVGARRRRCQRRIGGNCGGAVFILGLSMYLCMLRPPFLGSLLVGSDADAAAMRFSYFLGILLFGLVLALFPVADGSKRADSLRSMGVCVGASVVGIAAVSTMQFSLSQFSALTLSAVAGICLGFAALTWGWISALSRMSVHDAVVACLIAFVISHLFGLLDVMPRYLASSLSVCYPLFSYLLLSYSESELEAASAYPKRCSRRKRETAEIGENRTAVAALFLIVMVVLGSAFLRSVYCQNSSVYNPTDKVVSMYAASALTGALFTVAAMLRWSSPKDIVVAGLASAVLFSVLCVMYGLGLGFASIPFTTGLCSVLQAYAMGLIAALPIGHDARVRVRAGAFCVLFAVSSIITYSIIPGAATLGGALSDRYNLAVVSCGELVALLGVIATLLMVAGNSSTPRGTQQSALALAREKTPMDMRGRTSESDGRTGGDEAGALPMDKSLELPSSATMDAYREAVDRATAGYGLTERERETAALISRGFTAKRVAEELSIATGTVQSYSKSIYRKMGIHKKDELIDAVEAQRH